jgi:RNA 2',3'-cyclic 3'-phosphodiesterase
MRLFIAVLPPPGILDEVERAIARHRPAWPGVRWLPRDNWHLTLTFLGEVDEVVHDRLLPRLDRVAHRHAPFDLEFAGAGAFPRPAQARVVWTGLRGDLAALARLAATTSAAARRAGAPPDRHKKFNPHLSVARVRESTDLRPVVAALDPFTGTPWPVDSIHLVRSNLGQAVRYETLHSWPLDATTTTGPPPTSAPGDPPTA